MREQKLILILLYLTIYVNGTLWAQEENHVFHYPLNIGDVWEYRRSPGFLDTRKVIGDTLMPNGKTYRVIERVLTGITSFFFQRVSEANEVLGPPQPDSVENILYKLDIKVGDSWTFPLFGGNPADSAFSEVFQIADTTIFSSRFKFARIESFTLLDSAPLGFGKICILVDSIGIFFQGFEAGKNELQGAVIDGRQFGVITSVRPPEYGPLEKNNLFFNNYPNPFNNSTTIAYQVDSPNPIKVTVFNLLGARIKLLVDSIHVPGTYQVDWFGDNETGRLVSSGIYILRLEINNRVFETKTILLLK